FCCFFQAEDGIRDFHVTGVQTCALPICAARWHCRKRPSCRWTISTACTTASRLSGRCSGKRRRRSFTPSQRLIASVRISTRKTRSEERRVGKEWSIGAALWKQESNKRKK